ncbi:hypothetical protein LTR84_010052 [Exophiala bonariae]|uniref:Xylose isomerase-like TIM barrel domain-containing protein n=1 Tax=Exophiala bonariae TaxID=1690606 RepID=A0AAV9NKI8_9EURO|nr:hypothetical protein LTR84_010052 [Exophiala bonariae]
MLDNRLAIASVSLGEHDSHTLPNKITAAAQNGFAGIEITYPDLQAHAAKTSTPILDAARQIKVLCQENGIHVLALASFQNYEGSLHPLIDRLKKAEKWLEIARTLGAEHLQIPSNYERVINNDHRLMVSELRQLADLASAKHPVIRVAYENLAWSSHCTTWQEALMIVQEVNRDNFGLCLDSFHLSTFLWADPYSPSSRQADGDERLRESLQKLVKNCPLDKLFYIQLSDGEPMDPPYSESHPWFDPSLEPGHVWSNEARPFPLETEYGAFMPVQEISQAFLVDLSFKGWVSLETFDRRMRKPENGPSENAKRGVAAWQNLHKRLSQRQRFD